MRIQRFTVVPSVPARLQPLLTLSGNVWWTWHSDAVELFRRIDPVLWTAVSHNPVRLLGSVPPGTLEALAEDETFIDHMDRIAAEWTRYMADTTTWWGVQPAPAGFRVGYFSMEFGLHESVPTYSGGLGVLAGDHLKSASDLGLPLVAVGLAYREGYFRQYLTPDGWQQERYPENDFYNMPMALVRDAAGAPVTVHVPVDGRDVHAQIWRIDVGRVPMYLLDANIDTNAPEDRALTAQLYGGDSDTRVRQEILLGVGGVRALAAVGATPTVFHMNEGHAAFLVFERLAALMHERGLSFREAEQVVTASNVFTTHTPVPAGNDRFPPELIQRYFGHTAARLGLGMTELLALGRENPKDDHEHFCMTVLALRFSAHANGVSALHGTVSRRMWRGLWPGVSTDEVPIDAVVNGVHAASWVSPDLAAVYDRYLGRAWRDAPSQPASWRRAGDIPDPELWRAHERRRERLVGFTRRRLKKQLADKGYTGDLRIADEVLDPEALTIGFARRFATYKRATLMFRDPERLARVLGSKHRPVQIIIAGKAHPKDKPGKEFIRAVNDFARRDEFRRRVVFIEDYDMNVARHLVQGVDVWLNTPRRPYEASGTSGMKAALNGGLHLSVLDGWWAEAYEPGNGWALGAGEEYDEAAAEQQDEIEAHVLLDLLEHEIVPAFYDRGPDRVPHRWTAMMTHAIRTIGPVFNTDRMVKDYTVRFYLDSGRRAAHLTDNGFAVARAVAAWRDRVDAAWPAVQFAHVAGIDGGVRRVGEPVPMEAWLKLGGLSPDDVIVEAAVGPLDAHDALTAYEVVALTPVETAGDSVRFAGNVPTDAAGRMGVALRVRPQHPSAPVRLLPDRLRWA